MKALSTRRFFYFPLLTLRGFGVLCLGALIPLGGILVDVAWPALALLVAIYLGSFFCSVGLNALSARRFIRSLDLSIAGTSQVYSGVETELAVAINGAPELSQATLLIRPVAPEQVRLTKDLEQIEVVPNSLPTTLTFPWLPLARGVAAWDLVVVRVTLGLRLCTWQVELRPPEALSQQVLPNRGFKAGLSLKAFRKLQHGEQMVEGVRDDGREVHSLRQYAVGDDLRRVDWKRSARTRTLVVKEFRPETHQRVNIALDCGRRMGNRLQDRLQIEYATDAIAQLTYAVNASEDEVGLFAFSHRIVTRIDCRRGARQEQLIVNALSAIQTEPVESDYQLLARWAATSSRRSLLVLITSLSNPVGLESIRNAMLPLRRRHLPLVFAIADQPLQELTTQPTESLTEAYAVAAGVEQLERIKQGIQLLKRSGIECCYCQGSELAEQVRARYYEIKRLGKL